VLKKGRWRQKANGLRIKRPAERPGRKNLHAVPEGPKPKVRSWRREKGGKKVDSDGYLLFFFFFFFFFLLVQLQLLAPHDKCNAVLFRGVITVCL
jgi:hypothetical protein